MLPVPLLNTSVEYKIERKAIYEMAFGNWLILRHLPSSVCPSAPLDYQMFCSKYNYDSGHIRNGLEGPATHLCPVLFVCRSNEKKPENVGTPCGNQVRPASSSSHLCPVEYDIANGTHSHTTCTNYGLII